MEYNIYCDESCHLENDGQKVMVLGAVWCPKEKAPEVNRRIREIVKINLPSENFEIKWNKVSDSRSDLYLQLVDYFFDDDDLHFRTLIVPNKQSLDHTRFSQNHDQFYYKMFYDLLKTILEPGNSYNIFLDIKDTQGASRLDKLSSVLCNSHLDFERKMIKKIQHVRSHEVALIQLSDLLIGSISYFSRGLSDNKGKLKVIDRIIDRSGYSLKHSTLIRESKFNIFYWQSR